MGSTLGVEEARCTSEPAQEASWGHPESRLQPNSRERHKVKRGKW